MELSAASFGKGVQGQPCFFLEGSSITSALTYGRAMPDFIKLSQVWVSVAQEGTESLGVTLKHTITSGSLTE